MKINFERSGGFAGMLLTANLDTEKMPSDEAQQLQDLIAAAQFFDLPAKPEGASSGADHFQYRITIETDTQMHTVETTDAAAPETLRPLLRRLSVLARAPKS
jgi:hypothetical protein